MKKQPEFIWDEEAGIATCKIYYKDQSFCAIAMCHPDDLDVCSRTCGEHIAHSRASIKYFQFIKNNEIKPKLQALRQLYYSMNRSKQYNKKSYEARMLYRQIKNYETDLEVFNEVIESIKAELRGYIKMKDKVDGSRRTHKEQVNKD